MDILTVNFIELVFCYFVPVNYMVCLLSIPMQKKTIILLCLRGENALHKELERARSIFLSLCFLKQKIMNVSMIGYHEPVEFHRWMSVKGTFLWCVSLNENFGF